ncbi:hypothetical protein Flavo103_12770 [Flavobacterium collinsii]|uniref:hypothetical protein n=1 Tax=Flavobacterium collinsii TaxID=1114861 RepID=UPI0022C90702|nr:hypothetical protein [Flavobacterium collinsii]GIQ58141.1 hypothetical protein Flavo103_12770 [Flavobacterium collinsii]
MKKNILLCSALLMLLSCTQEHKKTQLVYQNIVIISDLSSRINNKQCKDIDEIHKILHFFKTECVKPGEKIGDQSSISFSPFSEKTITSIDIGKIKGFKEKQRFINSTEEYRNKGLEQKLLDFQRDVKFTYANTHNDGLDLISILSEKIANEPITKKDTILTDGIDTTLVKYNNHLYVFTDGYLEYIDNKRNSQFYFSNSEIDKVRQFCKTNNVDISKALEINSSLSLPPNKSIKNQYINLHVLETHERDKNDKLQSYKYPKGQRDNEILQAVWKKWAMESGFKSFEWKKY